MKKIAWITDTTPTLSEDFIKKHNIHVVSLNIIFGEDTYKENEDITIQQFYDRLPHEKIAKTSQPAIGDFVALYERLKEEYEVGIAIHATSELTGTYNTSVQAAEMAGFNLKAIDSRIGSYPVAKMIEQAVAYEKEGKSVEEIVQYVEQLTKKTELHLVPSNLDQLKKSGRLSNGQAILASLLKVNLIIKFDEGKVVLSEKIRTPKKLKAYLYDLLEKLQQETDEVCIIHGDDEEAADKWKEIIQNLYPNLSVRTLVLCPVAAVHTGKGTIGFSWIKK